MKLLLPLILLSGILQCYAQGKEPRSHSKLSQNRRETKNRGKKQTKNRQKKQNATGYQLWTWPPGIFITCDFVSVLFCFPTVDFFFVIYTLWRCLTLLSTEIYGYCTTPTEQRGTCIQLSACGYLYDIVQRRQLSADERSLLQNSQCGYRDGQVLVSTTQELPNPEPVFGVFEPREWYESEFIR